MNKLDNVNTIIDQIGTELTDENFLVCTEGKERYWTADGQNNDMSNQRVIAFLEDEIRKRYRQKTEKLKSPLPPLAKGKPTELAGQIKKKVLCRNVIKEALEFMPGWPTGITKWDGETFLVRRGLAPLTPKEGKWKELRTMIETFFGRHTEDSHYETQIHAFYCLMRAKLLQMNSTDNQRGSCPMLVVMSEPDTGKSFILRLLALLLGGTERTVDPSKEKNGWSDSCLSSPIIFYDEASREEFDFSGGMNREKFAEFFKGMEYSSHAEIARRGYTARSWPAVWLWARALNTNSRAAILQTPIPTENAMDDKLILAQVYRAEMPFPDKEDPETRAKRLNLLKGQLPAFSHWLLNEFQKEMNDDFLKRPNGEPYRNETHPSIHPDVLEVLTSSENDSAKSITVENYLRAYPAEELFTAGQLLAEANRLASDMDSLPETKALMKMFKSGLSLGRTLSQMSDDPDSGITRHPSGNTNRYEYEPSVKEDSAAA
ncbi:hypothetical protein OAF44_01470 [Akkermansiaceae bacterium]|nr:hypothetical protein [Akkermansiaceae bacterium]MDB4725173.1 hypothetical protein [Akkermansiaceae bacterium]